MSATAGVSTVKAQDDELAISAGRTLVRISANILKNPDDVKFQTVKTSTSVFQSKILPCSGAVQCLLEMGFKMKEGEKFTFDRTCFNELWRIHHLLVDMLRQKNVVVEESAVQRMPTALERLSTLSHNEVFRRLSSHVSHANVYENARLQEKARSCVPQDELKSKARNIYDSRANKDDKGGEKKTFEHILLLQLLAWFKKDFFKWTDKPKCPNCPDSTVNTIGPLPPTSEEKSWGAGVVEGYRCPSCASLVRFPRYNHPGKLLETRNGRCGEWANCFTLICRAMGFEARHVTDWSDHVWTEVYLYDRWIHCDPCENIMDKPLVYERGWKKKLTLIVAANSTQVVDVTRRYCRDGREDMWVRRNAILLERWLEDLIRSFNSTQQSRMNDAQKEKIRAQMAKEQQELAWVEGRGENDEEYGGRTSGSLAWRVGRGEINPEEQRKSNWLLNEPITPNAKELIRRRFCLEYSSVTDHSSLRQILKSSTLARKLIKSKLKRYNRPVGEAKEFCWESLVCKSLHVMRKEEFDWRKTYLCRCETAKRGYITWSVSLPTDYSVRQLTIVVQSETFHAGSVTWLLTSEGLTDVIVPGVKNIFQTRYSGARTISLKALMRHDGEESADGCSWQHAQLFRRGMDETDRPQLIIDMTLNKF